MSIGSSIVLMIFLLESTINLLFVSRSTGFSVTIKIFRSESSVYTGFITLTRGHRIRVIGEWLSDNIFKAKKIEDLTTDEFWEFFDYKDVLIVFLL